MIEAKAVSSTYAWRFMGDLVERRPLKVEFYVKAPPTWRTATMI